MDEDQRVVCGIWFFPAPCGSWELNSGCQAWHLYMLSHLTGSTMMFWFGWQLPLWDLGRKFQPALSLDFWWQLDTSLQPLTPAVCGQSVWVGNVSLLLCVRFRSRSCSKYSLVAFEAPSFTAPSPFIDLGSPSHLPRKLGLCLSQLLRPQPSTRKEVTTGSGCSHESAGGSSVRKWRTKKGCPPSLTLLALPVLSLSV